VKVPTKEYKSIAVRRENTGARYALEISIFEWPEDTSTFSFHPETERRLPLTRAEAEAWVVSLGAGLPAGLGESLVEELAAEEDPLKAYFDQLKDGPNTDPKE
jgi:hypothetical protein